jgi:hypothetical protein
MTSRSGLTLVETLIYMTVTSMVIGIACSVYYSLSGTVRLHESCISDIERAVACGERIKEDIRSHVDAPDSLGESRQSKTQLLLKSTTGSVVIYTLEKGDLVRYGGKPTDAIKRVAVLNGVADLSFRRKRSASGTLIEADIRLTTRGRKVRVRPAFRIAEKLGLGGEYAGR